MPSVRRRGDIGGMVETETAVDGTSEDVGFRKIGFGTTCGVGGGDLSVPPKTAGRATHPIATLRLLPNESSSLFGTSTTTEDSLLSACERSEYCCNDAVRSDVGFVGAGASGMASGCAAKPRWWWWLSILTALWDEDHVTGRAGEREKQRIKVESRFVLFGFFENGPRFSLHLPSLRRAFGVSDEVRPSLERYSLSGRRDRSSLVPGTGSTRTRQPVTAVHLRDNNWNRARGRDTYS